MKQDIKGQGRFILEHLRGGKVIGKHELDNGITNGGKDALLNIMFHASTQITTWYVGLIDNSGYTGVAAADAMDSHSGWAEWTSYDEANRQEWTEGAASSQSMTNATAMTFTISASGSVRGIFVTSSNTKSGTSGTLWSTGLFSGAVPVQDDDQFKITYTVSVS